MFILHTVQAFNPQLSRKLVLSAPPKGHPPGHTQGAFQTLVEGTHVNEAMTLLLLCREWEKVEHCRKKVSTHGKKWPSIFLR